MKPIILLLLVCVLPASITIPPLFRVELVK